jgi:hypothetical protein
MIHRLVIATVVLLLLTAVLCLVIRVFALFFRTKGW